LLDGGTHTLISNNTEEKSQEQLTLQVDSSNKFGQDEQATNESTTFVFQPNSCDEPTCRAAASYTMCVPPSVVTYQSHFDILSKSIKNHDSKAAEKAQRAKKRTENVNKGQFLVTQMWQQFN
jgi:hypothetical protein